VFLQGSGESILDWKKLRPPASALTRACFYDRAGFGYSDPLEKEDATAIAATDDLRDLLHAAAIERPVVLVGHSLGGLIATLYADRFPRDVGGLVLVDTSFATQFAYPISARGRWIVENDQREYLNSMRKCLALAKAEELSRSNTHDCFALPTGWAPDESRYLIHQYTRAEFYEARISETENFLPIRNWKSVDGDEEKAFRRDFGNMPVEVLTAGVTPRNPRKSEADNRNFALWWSKGHRKLAARSTRGEEFIVPNVGHNIQDGRPDAVLMAIEKVVAMVRRERR
jgi:pimeloyl-ACP methyl ester carboxylesterase